MKSPNDIQEREADLARLDARHDQETRHMPPPQMDIRAVFRSRAEKGQRINSTVFASVPSASSLPGELDFGDRRWCLVSVMRLSPLELWVEYRVEP